MSKKGWYVLFLIWMQFNFAQNKVLWQGYYSYNEIKDLAQTPTAILAASENALFTKDNLTNVIKTTTTIDGLSGQTISALYYSQSINKTLIGYENGLIIVINETDGSVLKIVDIINKNLPANLKKINHFMEHEGLVYISCDFGIIQFNLKTLQFGDTYFIGNNGTQIGVKQTTFYNGFIFAATIEGVRKADITNKNLIDFNQWASITSGNWSSIEAFGTELLAINTSGHIYKYNSTSNDFVGYRQLPQAVKDMRKSANYLIVTTSNSVYFFNNQMTVVRQIDSNQITESTVSFTCATNIGDVAYIGTNESGLINTNISVSSVVENITPIGPTRNNIFSIHVTPTQLWTTYGNYDIYYNPYPLDNYGLSKYSGSGWLNIPYEYLFEAKSISRIIVNPNNENEVYASSFFSGLLKLVADKPTILYNEKNSGLETLTFLGPNYIDVRINGTAFDKSGNLWMNNSLIKNGLKVFKTDGTWQSFSMKTILDMPEDASFGSLVIDKNNTKWIATNREGVIGFNEKNTVFKKITTGSETGNLPIADVRSLAVDTKNQLWIGTINGLRILSNINNFQTDNQLIANPIIILEDDLAQELLYEQFITAIVVDGANNKWIGTADSGVFMVSPNGQETKYHFTINNSPLPSNTINDIGINSTSGEVFIATNKGMVSFKGVATVANDNLDNVYVYPNPVRPEFSGTVKIAGLLDKANIKITDIEGNLVYETTSEGGTIEWDTTAFGKHKVASGVYMIFISAQDGIETKVKKVMIIR